MRLFLLLTLCTLLCGCSTVVSSTRELPFEPLSKFTVPHYDPSATPVGAIYADETADETVSGAMIIKSGSFALFHRVALARMATRTIEMQTYIYETDITSRLLIHEMKSAADRGVKVRILVDDLGLDSDNSEVMTLDAHPNIEVKVFNTFKYRLRLLRYPQLVLDLPRLNYRMHNKLFIVDNSAVIIGGRNIASNYFDNSVQVNFSDTDVLFLGKIARESVQSFNEYWVYHKSIPASLFPSEYTMKDLEKLDRKIIRAALTDDEDFKEYESIISSFTSSYYSKQYPVYWGEGVLLGDKPEKTDGNNPVSPITEMLEYLFEVSRDSIYISAAYLVPGAYGNEAIINSKKNGVDINILTNSLSSTDAKIVYSGWKNYRDELLANGINIYEFRNEGYKVKNRVTSGASLHSKVIVFDEEITWVGSFNLDGRSASINTEVVAAFHSSEFADIIVDSIKEDMSPDNSWLLKYDEGKITWHTIRDGKPVTSTHSPDTSFAMRALMSFLSSIVPEILL